MNTSIWLVTFMDSFQQQMSGSFLPYVTSSFSLHGLVATTNIVATVVAGISKIPLARLMDVVGRNEGLMVMLGITVIGKFCFPPVRRLKPRHTKGANSSLSDQILPFSPCSHGRVHQCHDVCSGPSLLLGRHERRRLCAAGLPIRHNHVAQSFYLAWVDLDSLPAERLYRPACCSSLPRGKHLEMGLWCFCPHHSRCMRAPHRHSRDQHAKGQEARPDSTSGWTWTSREEVNISLVQVLGCGDRPRWNTPCNGRVVAPHAPAKSGDLPS